MIVVIFNTILDETLGIPNRGIHPEITPAKIVLPSLVIRGFSEVFTLDTTEFGKLHVRLPGRKTVSWGWSPSRQDT